MKSLLATSLWSTLAGLGLGAVLAYVEVPAAVEREQPKKPAQPVAKEPQVAPPKAELPETVYNFDKIERGTSMSHRFKIRNVGESPLRVNVASTTCKCTVGELDKNEIAPKEESDVLLEWVAKTAPGPFRHGAVLSTNDPAQTSIELTVEGQVIESTSMSPSRLFFGTMRTGESPKASLYLMTFLDQDVLNQDVKILDYEIVDQALAKRVDIKITPAQLSELPTPDAVGGVKIEATFRSGKRVGPFQGWLNVTTNLKKAEKLMIPIGGNVQGDVSLFGSGWDARKGLLRMGSFPGTEGKSVRLNLAVRGENASEANWETAEVDPPELKVSLGESRKMNDRLLHVPLQIELPPGTRPMVRMGEPTSSEAQVVLRSNHPEIPDLQMRIKFAVE